MFAHKKVVITGASRDFGVALAWNFAKQGATVFASARRLQDAQKTCDQIRSHDANADVRPLQCDLTDPADIRAAAALIQEQTDSIDLLVHNGSQWLQQDDFIETSDDKIVSVINSGTTGPILLTKHLLPLLQRSPGADIVNMISKAAESGFVGDGPHEAFYAMKHGHAGFADVLAHRLKKDGIRVLSLFPPDFHNTSPFDSDWGKADDKLLLNAKNLIDTINFALSQPRNCTISKIYFDGNRR
ncbi:MAG: SDR family NAD(P)-dependent oxidoreductase [Burkholderiales bacterium]|nr:SDR family NAD(P)-dependent oxidoreductase [Burkholderiales bacterium]